MVFKLLSNIPFVVLGKSLLLNTYHIQCPENVCSFRIGSLFSTKFNNAYVFIYITLEMFFAACVDQSFEDHYCGSM